MDKRKAEKPEGVKKKIYLVLIFIILFVVGFLFKNVVFELGGEKEEPLVDPTHQTVSPMPNDEADIDHHDAAAVMQLEVEMPKELKERVDYDSFIEEFERYLIDNDFWSDVTTATSDYMLVEDLKSGTVVMTFELNDYADTTVNVVVENGGIFTFSHY